METYEQTMKRLSIYHEIELSEKQFSEGKTKDAKESLTSLREKYDL